MSAWVGKTVFITGGSRGIGLAIGLRFAREGANVAIAAKEEINSATSIYTASEQIIAAGGQALPLNIDVCDVSAIKNAVDKTVAQFGGIDLLINNVSAFCFTDTINTQPQQFDLLFSVNARATFFVSQACVPYLKRALNPQIINISPPLAMEPKWFKNHLAFTMSKYGMSMCTLGMAAELQSFNIAVNSLWPRTTIATTTIQDHFLPEVYKGSRWPTIMADAAFELAEKKSSDCTGNFFIDEQLLRETGITDFSSYAVDCNSPLVGDLFVPEMIATKEEVPLAKELFIINEKN